MSSPVALESARERALETAERLFAQRGYSSVTLRDVATEIGIRHTSLYHHFPGGKEQLYLEVMDRTLRAHLSGLNAVADAGGSLRDVLYAIADWFLTHPPMDLIRMVHSDLPAIKPEHSQRLQVAVHTSIIVPVERVVEHAAAAGELSIKAGTDDAGLVAGGLIGMLESLHSVPDYAVRESRTKMACRLIDVILDGLLSPTG